MSAFFVGCTQCSAMLVLADADGPARARRAGWVLSAGWRCSKHPDVAGAELETEPPPADETRTAIAAGI